jgi:hypothetical protein
VAGAAGRCPLPSCRCRALPLLGPSPCHRIPAARLQRTLLPPLAGASGAAGGGGRNAVEAREAVLADQNLLALVFKHLPLEDLCRAAIVRKAWRSVTDNPDFWETICLKGRIAHEAKVRLPAWVAAAPPPPPRPCRRHRGPASQRFGTAVHSSSHWAGGTMWRAAGGPWAGPLGWDSSPLPACSSLCARPPPFPRSPTALPPSAPSQVCRLLQQHPGVRVLEARGVPFSSANLCSLLPQLT